MGELKQPGEEKEWFEEHLKTLLQSLYNPSVLRSSPLVALLGVHRRGDSVTIFRDLVLNGIEALRPGNNTPRDSRTWRIYTILRRRYVEQVAQEVVAKDMGLSVRQLQREEKVSRQVLADYLWEENGLGGMLEELHRLMAKHQPPVQEPGSDTRTREIEWLQESAPYEDTDISLLVQEVLATAAPILRMHKLEVQHIEEKVRASLPAVLVRQALLNILAVLSKTFPGGECKLLYTVSAMELAVWVDCSIPLAETAAWNQDLLLQQYEDAVSLLRICSGSLAVRAPCGENRCFTDVKVPLKRQFPVLVIDDNADSLVLMERYLAGSSYRFYGVREGSEAVGVAGEVQPDVIVLDVMMPDQDGWNILGQLREHPSTSQIPVIICTILAQHDLALALGAADFLRKPVSRQGFLAMLDRLLATQSKASD